MFGPKIWDYYADRYEKLWVQRFVLNPSRQLILKTMRELPSSKRILDVGCGIGELCHSMSRQDPLAKIIGIDPSMNMIKRAEEKYAGKNIQYICGYHERLPKDHPFDLVVSTNAFPYMPDKRKALSDIKKLLKPNGRLLLLFANRNSLYDAFWLMFVKMTTSKAHYPSVSSTHDLLTESGFEVGMTEPIESLFFVPSVFMVEGILPGSAGINRPKLPTAFPKIQQWASNGKIRIKNKYQYFYIIDHCISYLWMNQKFSMMKINLEKEILDTMSKNPGNWKGIFYFNRQDPRLIVPKLNPLMGWTLNFASPYSYLFLIALIVIIVGSQFLK